MQRSPPWEGRRRIGGPLCLLGFPIPPATIQDPPCVRGVTADADAALHHVSGSRPSQSQAGSRTGKVAAPPLIRGAGAGTDGDLSGMNE